MIEKKKHFEYKIYSSLDKAAAVENDETMIINSDHSIITTPVESPQDAVGTSTSKLVRVESDDTTTSDTSSSEVVLAGKNKRHRMKARSESYRSEKYAKTFLFSVQTFFLIKSFNECFVNQTSISVQTLIDLITCLIDYSVQ